MNVFEKIREKLKERIEGNKKYTSTPLGNDARNQIIGLKKAIEIINQAEQEYNNGWIPCSERLPEDMQQCLTTARIYVVPDHVDEPDNYIGVELNTYSERFGWLHGNDVFAWMPLPEPYQGE